MSALFLARQDISWSEKGAADEFSLAAMYRDTCSSCTLLILYTSCQASQECNACTGAMQTQIYIPPKAVHFVVDIFLLYSASVHAVQLCTMYSVAIVFLCSVLALYTIQKQLLCSRQEHCWSGMFTQRKVSNLANRSLQVD